MTYYTDGNGNYYCGRFSSQLNYSYNTSDLVINNSAGTLRTDLTTIFGLLNYRFSSFGGTWVDGTPVTSANVIGWKTANDPTITLVKRSQLNTSTSNITNAHYKENGLTSITNQASSALSNHSYMVNQYGITLISHSITNLITPDYKVMSLTELIDVNSTSPSNSVPPYYSGFYKNRLCLYAKLNVMSTFGQHFVEQTNTVNKSILLTDEALYSIVCNDGQTAGTDLWMTKLHVFDSTLRVSGVLSKRSRIGTISNMAIGIGTSWEIGRIYSPTTNLFPGNNNNWLCVGKWNNLSDRFVLVNVWSI